MPSETTDLTAEALTYVVRTPTGDGELDAIQAIESAMHPLRPEQRQRVLAFVTARQQEGNAAHPATTIHGQVAPCDAQYKPNRRHVLIPGDWPLGTTITLTIRARQQEGT
jgi:hypothetical protein